MGDIDMEDSAQKDEPACYPQAQTPTMGNQHSCLITKRRQSRVTSVQSHTSTPCATQPLTHLSRPTAVTPRTSRSSQRLQRHRSPQSRASKRPPPCRRKVLCHKSRRKEFIREEGTRIRSITIINPSPDSRVGQGFPCFLSSPLLSFWERL